MHLLAFALSNILSLECNESFTKPPRLCLNFQYTFTMHTALLPLAGLFLMLLSALSPSPQSNSLPLSVEERMMTSFPRESLM